jgi:hypothetical protein
LGYFEGMLLGAIAIMCWKTVDLYLFLFAMGSSICWGRKELVASWASWKNKHGQGGYSEQSKFCRLSINSRLSSLTVGDSCTTFHNLWKLYAPFVGSAWPTGQERVQVSSFNTRMEWIVLYELTGGKWRRQVRPKWGHSGSDQWCV